MNMRLQRKFQWACILTLHKMYLYCWEVVSLQLQNHFRFRLAGVGLEQDDSGGQVYLVTAQNSRNLLDWN